MHALGGRGALTHQPLLRRHSARPLNVTSGLLPGGGEEAEVGEARLSLLLSDAVMVASFLFRGPRQLVAVHSRGGQKVPSSRTDPVTPAVFCKDLLGFSYQR